MGLAYRFCGSVHYRHSGKHGSMQADMALEELRVLHLVLKKQEKTTVFQAARRRVSKPTPTVTHFLQQGHTCSNKATPAPTRPHLLIVPLPEHSIFKSQKH